MHTREEKMKAFGRFLDVLDTLREKCPWDKKQTNESLRPNTIEETYELCDALMNNDQPNICKELGDVLLHICFYAKIGQEKEQFDIADVCNKLTDKLQQTEITERQFVSDASHELKTPLASIKLLSDSILQNDMDADTMREFVSDIGNESDRLTRMTQKLLTLSKADAQTTCEHEVVDLGETVRRVFRMLVPLADRTEIKLTANLDRGCYVLSMEDDAYQIIFNLVENGIKYNHAGGSVHVTARHTQDEAELLVEDTGMGIPQDAIEHIFERFYRVDKARSRQAGGSGLGLSIVHELVERNFGTIEVSSKEGEGTKFTVRMPYFELEEDDGDA